MTLICEKKISAEFHRFKKKEQTQLKTEQLKQDILS